MKSRLLIIITVVFCQLIIFAPMQTTAQVKITTIKLAHENPVGDPLDNAFNFFAKVVREKTNGEIEVKVFPAGQLGDESSIIEGVKVGTLDAGAGTLSPDMDPMYNLVYLPFLFRDSNHMRKVFDGPIGKELKAKAFKNGYKVMGIYVAGFHHFINNKRPINVPDDLKGMQIRVMGVPPYKDGMKQYGAICVSVPYGEMYTSLRSGVIDGAEQNLVSINVMKFYEVIKYLSLSSWAGAADGMFLSTRLWNSLPPNHQKALEEAGRESEVFYEKAFQLLMAQSLDAIKKAGVKVNDVNRSSFYPAAEKVYKMYEKDVPASLVERIKNVK